MPTLAEIERGAQAGHPLRWYAPGRKIVVRDKMQRYSYELTEAPGRGFARGFQPSLTPAQMLRRGVFEGKYLNDCTGELPREWYLAALGRGRLAERADPGLNEFKIKSRLPLSEWEERGWIIGNDPRGWFQWYCRYWLGRREPETDARQIARWRSFARHRGQILAAARRLPAARRPRTAAEKRLHRPRQRQALLQWAYDPYC